MLDALILVLLNNTFYQSAIFLLATCMLHVFGGPKKTLNQLMARLSLKSFMSSGKLYLKILMFFTSFLLEKICKKFSSLSDFYIKIE